MHCTSLSETVHAHEKPDLFATWELINHRFSSEMIVQVEEPDG